MSHRNQEGPGSGRGAIGSLDQAQQFYALELIIGMPHMSIVLETRANEFREERNMNWVAPIVEEICVGMEVTSYDSADISVEF